MSAGLFDPQLVEAAWVDVEMTPGGQFDEEFLEAPPVAAPELSLLTLLGVG
jgi:hypothetical protein